MSPESIIKNAYNSGVLLFVDEGKLGFQLKDGCVFSNELKMEVKTHKSSIIEYIKAHESGYVNRDVQSIKPFKRDANELELSFAQQRLWLLDQLQGSSAEYNMPIALNVSGCFKLDVAEAAICRIIERHEPLRTTFKIKGERTLQVIQSNWAFSIKHHNLANLDLDIQQKAAQELATRDSLKPFDLSKDLMLRASYIQLSNVGSEERGVLLFNMHHISSDGWSMNILVNEFLQQYKSIELGESDPLLPLEIQYADYAYWQRQSLSNEYFESQLSYWKKQLKDIPATHGLLLDAPRPESKSFRGALVESYLDSSCFEKLQKIAKEHEMTTFMLIHAALSVVISRHSNSHDIVVGTAVANRTQAELEPLIGFFVNMLALRVNTRSSSVSEYFANVRQVNLDALANQDIPFDHIVEQCSVSRSAKYSPLVQIIFTMNSNEDVNLEMPETEFSVMDSEVVVAKFDLDLNAKITNKGINFSWQYDTSIFKLESISTLSEHLNRFLSNLANIKDTQTTNLAQVDMYSDEESDYLLHRLNDTQVQYPENQLVHEIFEQHAKQKPDRIAVKFAEEQLTYGELNERANQLAHYLIGLGVEAEDLIGISIERSAEMVVALLATLKAGAAYVPLDPNYPEARVQYMIDDAGLEIIMTHSNLPVRNLVNASQALCLDDKKIIEEIAKQSKENPDPKVLGLNANNLIYILYTSGSTGNPKGVMVEHQSLLNTLRDTASNFNISDSSTLLQSTSMNFDGGSWVVWVSLIHEACFLICDESVMYGESIEESINKHQVTHLMMTPSSVMLIKEDEVDSLETIIVVGEAFNPQLISKWQNRVDLFNAYGPTEASVCATLSKVSPENHVITIGKPLKNTTSYVLSDTLDLLPANVVGELYLGGAGLSRGYLNRPDLTADKFIKNPFYDKSTSNSSELLYKTGDMVRWLPDGNLEYVGRIDGQVKIRGFRIELGEIENTLALHQNIRHCVVEVRESASGDKYLVAYVVLERGLNSEQTIDETMRKFLRNKLPDHMVPTQFVLLDILPLTQNGKVNRSALPEPDLKWGMKAYVAPSTETEQLLCDVWQKMLNIERVGVHDNFFALGGHSLMVVKLVSRLQEKGVSMNVHHVFSSETLQELASMIDLNVEKPELQLPTQENLIPKDCTHISPDMLPLVELNDNEIGKIVSQTAGGAKNIEDIYPLGPLQEGILFHYNIDKEFDPFISSTLFKVKDEAGLNNLIDALNFILERYEVLRAAVMWQELSVPVQVISRHVELPVERIFLDDERDDLSYAQELCLKSHSMDLSKAPLLRLKVVQTPNQKSCIALLQAHHMNLDHVSLEVIYEELTQYFLGKRDQLPDVLPYRKFISHIQQKVKMHDAETFFNQQLRGIDGPTTPFGLIDVQGNGSAINEANESVPLDICKQLRSVSRENNVSPAVLFHSAWSMVVAACSGRDDIVFGTVVSGRLQNSVGAERMLGLLMNTLPLRVKLANVNVYELVMQVQKSLKELLPFEQTPLATAQRCAALPINTPLFSAMLNYRHTSAPGKNTETGMNTGIEVISDRERANYPFSIMVDDYGVQFALKVQVSDTLSAQRIANYMQNALVIIAKGLSGNCDLMLSQLSILSADESAQLLAQGKADVNYNHRDAGMIQLFEKTVQKFPRAEAVRFEDFALNYAELNNKANQLAHYLLEMDVGVDCKVGIFVERSVEMLICILGIMKSGATYVPLDPAHPSERTKYIIDDADIELVLVNVAQVDSAALSGVDVLLVDNASQDPSWLSEYSHSSPQAGITHVDKESVVYILYTSGSTGQPKGVMVTQSALYNYVFYAKDNYLNPDLLSSVVSSSLSFDATITTLFTPLTSGGTVHMLAENDETLKLLAHHLLDDKPKLFKITPAHLEVMSQQLKGRNLSSNTCHKIVVGGEQLSFNRLLSWQTELLPNSVFINEYGPTESVVGCSTYTVQSIIDKLSDRSVVPIGKAISNVQLYVLDKYQKLVPRGVAGELLIGGKSLASGYVNNPALTTERFIKNPFYDVNDEYSSKRLYRTGDIVRWLGDGNLEFIGRIDEQVNIRGFRVELTEIEMQLICIDEVAEAAVKVNESNSGDKRLIGYVVPSIEIAEKNSHAYIEMLRQRLSASLPEYMQPSIFMLLDALPLTSNGKVDKKSLPAADMKQQQGSYVAPRSDMEKVLSEIWKGILGLEEISVTESFFNLGGHSLLAMRMLTRLESEIGVEVSISTFFMYPDIVSIAAYIDAVKLMPENITESGAEALEEGFI